MLFMDDHIGYNGIPVRPLSSQLSKPGPTSSRTQNRNSSMFRRTSWQRGVTIVVRGMHREVARGARVSISSARRPADSRACSRSPAQNRTNRMIHSNQSNRINRTCSHLADQKTTRPQDHETTSRLLIASAELRTDQQRRRHRYIPYTNTPSCQH